MKNLLLLSTILLLFTMCESGKTETANSNCPEIEPSEPFTETIYLNLDPTNDSFWQLCHAELEKSINPFVILTKISANKNDSVYGVKQMKFKTEPFLGDKNFYKILEVTKEADHYDSGKFNMYDVHIKVGLNNEEVTSDAISDFDIDKLTAFDYHITPSPALQKFISCNIEAKFKESVFFMNDLEKQQLEDHNICCGAICASRFVY